MITQEQLQSFCDDRDSSRWNTTTPTGIGDWTCATDTKCALMVHRNKEWEPEHELPAPPYDKIGLMDCWDGGEWLPWAETVGTIPPPNQEKCDNCNAGKCVCYGCDWVHECGHCKGTNRVDVFTRYEVLGYDYAVKLLKKFESIGPTECRSHLLPAKQPNGVERKHPAYCLLILGKGWRGSIMSMMPEEKVHS